jgi:hypothetical protein
MGNAGIRHRQNKLTRRWHVYTVGRNGERLNHSESLNSKEAVRVNIQATIDAVLHGTIDWPD